METDFPFVQIPERLLPVIGRCDDGTRIYRQEGSADARAYWFEALQEIEGQLISPGGVGMYAPVTRAAVHKRIKEGRLTAFCFHVKSTKKGFFGRVREVRQSPSIYLPCSEVKAWANELKARALSQGRISKEELEGAKPDWHGTFWKWNEKEHGK